MPKELRLTLSVRIFEQLAAEADATNVPSTELARRFISARYEQDEAVSAGAFAALPARDRSCADLQEGDAILSRATDAYGRIDQILGKIPTTAEGRRQLLAVGRNLYTLGDGIALLRELLDLVEELRRLWGPPKEAKPRTMPQAANDHWIPSYAARSEADGAETEPAAAGPPARGRRRLPPGSSINVRNVSSKALPKAKVASRLRAELSVASRRSALAEADSSNGATSSAGPPAPPNA